VGTFLKKKPTYFPSFFCPRGRLFFMLCIVFANCLELEAQWGNEWINYNERYWKIPIAQSGVYRVSYESLLQSGVVSSSTNWSTLQLFAKGRQSYWSLHPGADGVMGAGDFIEFFAEANDAWLDSLIYTQPNHVPNPKHSLFNDTLMYFITVGSEQGLQTSALSSSNYLDYPLAEYGIFRSEMEFHSEYLIGKQDINGISLPWYEEAEGWFDQRFPMGASHVKNLPTPFVYTSTDAPWAVVTTRCASASLAAGFPNHHLQVGWGNPLNIEVDTTYYGYQLNAISFALPPLTMANGSLRLVHQSVNDLGVAADWHAVSYLAVDYPRTWQVNGTNPLEMSVNRIGNATGVRLDIPSLPSEGWRLFVKDNGMVFEIELFTDAAGVHAVVPFSANQQVQKVFFLPPNQWLSPSSVLPVTASGFFTNYAEQETDSAFLLITAPSLWNAALNYAAYRENNGMNVVMADAEELYLQYAGGVKKHPLALRRFCAQLLAEWNSPPSHLFIIGKSIHEARLSANALGARNSQEWYAQNVVPTWGWPCSDLAFTAGLNGTLHEPAIPTGRLAARNEQDVLDYLNKVVEHEAHEPALWQKNILHFGGGSVSFEQNLFRNYLQNYEAIAEDTSFAGKVYTFLKSTSDPIALNLSDSIRLLIDEGVGMMTFFGHASSTGFDQNLDSPQSYNNQGKYPFLVGNSCYTGNIHLQDGQSASENFVRVPERGVIGFIAKPDLGIPAYLDMFTSNLYRNLFKENYGESMGQCIKRAIQDFQQSGDFYRENTALTFGLHGDPAVGMFTWNKPDYLVSAEEISFFPETVTAQIDSFDVRIAVQNQGRATALPVSVELVRHYPNGVDSSYTHTLPSLYREEVVVFRLPIDPLQGAGWNSFDVFVDFPSSLVEEEDDFSNNAIYQKQLFVSSGDVVPIYPYPFAIVGQLPIVLKASTGLVLDLPQTYRIQVDTSYQFNSPLLQEFTTVSSGGLMEWTPSLNGQDSSVYYWRCSKDSIVAGDAWNWREASFQYINGETGWSQADFFQFKPNERSGLSFLEETSSRDFESFDAVLKCEVYGNANTPFEQLGTRYQIDLEVQDYSGFGTAPSLMMAIIDSVSLQAFRSNYAGQHPTNEFGNTLASANARQRAERYFIFQQNDNQQLSGLANALVSGVEEGQYLLLYTWQFATKSTWPLALQNAFSALGADQILNAPDSVPFIFFQKKGDVSSSQINVGSSKDAYLSFETVLLGSGEVGTERSVIIGPGTNWRKAEWLFGQVQNSDSIQLILSGINAQGLEIPLIYPSAYPASINPLSDVSGIEQFNRLKWNLRLADGVDISPAQLKRWSVHFDEVPELAWDPASQYFVNKDTLQEGEDFVFSMALRNVSNTDMDSVWVHYWAEGANGWRREVAWKKLAAAPAGAILLDTIRMSTEGMSGLHHFFAEANPILPGGITYHQLEYSHVNNTLQYPFWVELDALSPIMDVTFDGIHIMDGEIVSAEPTIVVVLDDENEFLLVDEMADTSLFRLYVTSPIGDLRTIPFEDGLLELIPAPNNKNKSKLVYTPRFTQDGMYMLRVQARDKSGNASGNTDYEIRFEVINKATISEVFNYPNPFSTSTRFVFTLTGSSPPDEMKIQILNMGGDIVREIMGSELGPLRIGRNLTEFAWDGRDEFGDLLANGVYVYRVFAQQNGVPLEIRDAGGGQFMKNGWGKMYIMR
jgi:hypothetical protein